MKTYSIELPDDLADRLAVVAGRLKAEEAQLVRWAVASYLTGEPSDDRQTPVENSEIGISDFKEVARPTPGSFLDLSYDLAGCLEGPGDLSTNPEHMEGFGG